jgi:hypothetical protein
MIYKDQTDPLILHPFYMATREIWRRDLLQVASRGAPDARANTRWASVIAYEPLPTWYWSHGPSLVQATLS